MLDSIEDKQDLWLVMELCGKPLSKEMFEVKGEFYRGERIYSVIHKREVYDFFEDEDCLKFKEFISGMAQVLDLFSEAGIVHSDLKPENILLSMNEEGAMFKVIDLGSSFPLQKAAQFLELTTPEYLAPEILDYVDSKQTMMAQGRISLALKGDTLTNRMSPWSVDVWSLGAILLEMVSGFPLWLSYKGRIIKEGAEDHQTGTMMNGLFGT